MLNCIFCSRVPLPFSWSKESIVAENVRIVRWIYIASISIIGSGVCTKCETVNAIICSTLMIWMYDVDVGDCGVEWVNICYMYVWYQTVWISFGEWCSGNAWMVSFGACGFSDRTSPWVTFIWLELTQYLGGPFFIVHLLSYILGIKFFPYNLFLYI